MPTRRRASLLLLVAGLLALAGCKDEKTNLPFTFAFSPPSVVNGPTPIFFTLTSNDTDALVSASVSTDSGQTFKPATLAAGTPNPQQLRGTPDGAQQFFFWNPAADLAPGVYRRVRIRIAGLGRELGILSITPAFTVDLTDRLDRPSGLAPALTRPVGVTLADGTVWVAGGSSQGALSASGWRYDPRADLLQAAPGLSTPRSRPGTTRLTGGLALTVGGFDASGVPLAVIEGVQLTSGSLTPTPQSPLQLARGAPAVAALTNGRALIAGGQVAGGGSTGSVETLTPGGATAVAFVDPRAARREFTATALLDGRVLLAGGFDDAGLPASEAHAVDAAATGLTPAGGMGNPRGEHAAVRLPDGRVAIVGGTTSLGSDAAALITAEIYDPTSNTFSPLPSMTRARRGPGLIYSNGALVVFGGSGPGDSSTTAEQLPLGLVGVNASWSLISGPSATARPDALALATGNGRALVLGGDQPLERYTPDATLSGESFDALISVPRARADHTATRLVTGEVLIVGGTDGVSPALASVEQFEAFPTDSFSDGPSLARARTRHAAVAVFSGSVLVAGGRDANGLVATAELYDAFNKRWEDAGALMTPRADPSLTVLTDGRVLVAGGTDTAGNPVAQVEAWDPNTRTFSLFSTLTNGRADHDAIGVGLFGGNTVIGPGQATGGPVADVELAFSPSGTSRTVGAVARAGAELAEVPLGSGFVLVTGGVDGASTTRGDLEVLDARVVPPVFQAGLVPMQVPRSRHRAVSVFDRNLVLLCGGLNARGSATDEHEVYALTSITTTLNGATRRTVDTRGHRPRARHSVTPLTDGRALLVGGVDHRGVVIAGAEAFTP